ncbi:MAG: histidinol-phosphate transaminase [Ginsengibacter sp.]|jgi:histidinol-phosphate aminotransferase
MEKINIESLVRENIKKLKPYSSARSEYRGTADVFLDANENSYGSPLDENYHRYPDPLQWKLKQKLSKIKGVPPQNIFVGNGSDEVIDIAYRIFCEPGKDNVIICPPTYGMYKVCAEINSVEVKEVLLKPDFQLDIEGILSAMDEHTKLLFICSPNNPTGNSFNRPDVEFLLNNFRGIVLIDEAYINFSRQKPFIQELTEYENLVVMHTLSKAWGLAGLRLGLGFASELIIDLFNKVKPPYNVNESSQQLGIEALERIKKVNDTIMNTVQQRNFLQQKLTGFPFVQKVFPSDANFILLKVTDADKLYHYLLMNRIIVRNRSREPLCENCIRITVGTQEENEKILNALKKYE